MSDFNRGYFCAITNIAIGTIESNDPWLMTNRGVQCDLSGEAIQPSP